MDHDRLHIEELEKRIKTRTYGIFKGKGSEKLTFIHRLRCEGSHLGQR